LPSSFSPIRVAFFLCGSLRHPPGPSFFQVPVRVSVGPFFVLGSWPATGLDQPCVCSFLVISVTPPPATPLCVSFFDLPLHISVFSARAGTFSVSPPPYPVPSPRILVSPCGSAASVPLVPTPQIVVPVRLVLLVTCHVLWQVHDALWCSCSAAFIFG